MKIIDWNRLKDTTVNRKVARVKHLVRPVKGIEILDQKKCVFVHIPKNAGTSVSNIFFDRKRYLGHYKWWFYKACLQEKYENYFSFAFKRDPYSRLVSAFSYMKRGGNTRSDTDFLGANEDDFNCFDNFVTKLYHDKKFRNWVHFQPQTDFVYDHTDILQVSHLAEFEMFEEEMRFLATRMGITYQMHHVNQGEKRNLSDFYSSDKTINIVKDLYARDFDLLSYSDCL